MPISQWCWRCKMDVPMLDEAEWRIMEPLLSRAYDDVKRYRSKHGVSLAEAQGATRDVPALAKYKELTGLETSVNAIWHHRASLYGRPCTSCGKPLRTPKASFCAECGNAAA